MTNILLIARRTLEEVYYVARIAVEVAIDAVRKLRASAMRSLCRSHMFTNQAPRFVAGAAAVVHRTGNF